MNFNQNSNNAWDTLAVLGVLFQIQDADNHNFDSIVQGKDYVTVAYPKGAWGLMQTPIQRIIFKIQ